MEGQSPSFSQANMLQKVSAEPVPEQKPSRLVLSLGQASLQARKPVSVQKKAKSVMVAEAGSMAQALAGSLDWRAVVLQAGAVDLLEVSWQTYLADAR